MQTRVRVWARGCGGMQRSTLSGADNIMHASHTVSNSHSCHTEVALFLYRLCRTTTAYSSAALHTHTHTHKQRQRALDVPVCRNVDSG